MNKQCKCHAFENVVREEEIADFLGIEMIEKINCIASS